MDRNGASTSHDVFVDELTKASIPHVFMNVSIWAEFATASMMIDIILNCEPQRDENKREVTQPLHTKLWSTMQGNGI